MYLRTNKYVDNSHSFYLDNIVAYGHIHILHALKNMNIQLEKSDLRTNLHSSIQKQPKLIILNPVLRKSILGQSNINKGKSNVKEKRLQKKGSKA